MHLFALKPSFDWKTLTRLKGIETEDMSIVLSSSFNWKTLTRLKGIETHNEKQFYCFLYQYHWKTLTRLKGIETWNILYCFKYYFFIERHWPDLRGLKLYSDFLYPLAYPYNWKTLTRLKGIETSISSSLNTSISCGLKDIDPT